MMLNQLIDKRKAKIGIIGLGYVGLPLALEFAQAGFSVVGFDVDQNRVKGLKKGRIHIPDVQSPSNKALLLKKKLVPTTDFSKLKQVDTIIICVPTPLRKTKDPDISYIVAAVNQIKANLKKGHLIILESTTYPGTTREILLPMLCEKNKKPGTDFFLAFSPERVDPGNPRYGINNTPKVVGGIDVKSRDLAVQLYRSIIDQVIPVSNTEVAEMVKLLENTFRAVNIGLVNEVALMCDRLKLDTYEVIDAAATKPFGFMPFYPGPGLGGHCIPLDPHYLSWKLKTLNFYSRFIELAGDINSHMPDYVVRKITEALNEQKKPIKGSNVLVLGVSYKRDIGDIRESPALDVIQRLYEKKANVSYHDPYVPKLTTGSLKLSSRPLNAQTLKKQDCVVITTDHSDFNIKTIVSKSKVVVDTRNATKNLTSKKITKI